MAALGPREAVAITNRDKARSQWRCGCFSYVYVLRRQDGFYKIGTTVNVQSRLSSMKTALGKKPEVVYAIPAADGYAFEAALHRRFQAQRIWGEWFTLTNKDLREIEHMADQEPTPLHHPVCEGDPVPVTGDVVDTTYGGPGEWLSPSQAALRLDISERTLWRRVSRSILKRKVVAGNALIYVPMAGEMPATDAPAADSPVSGGVPAVRHLPDVVTLAVIEELRQQRQADNERLSCQADEIRTLAERAARAEARQAAAEAEVERLRGELADARRPWWRRLLS